MGARLRTSFLVLILCGFGFSVTAPLVGIAAAALTRSEKGRGRDIVLGADGSIYVTGVFRGTVDFDPGKGRDQHTAIGGYDVFVTRYAADGSYVGTHTFGRAGDDQSDGIEVKPDGTVILTGSGKLGAFVERFRLGA